MVMLRMLVLWKRLVDPGRFHLLKTQIKVEKKSIVRIGFVHTKKKNADRDFEIFPSKKIHGL